jgi:hypothetical protein
MRSALGIVIGLAARAEVTLFDEPYAGLDPVARELFYDRLLADYAEHPRTVLLSTHLIDEVAGLLERVVVIDRGRIMLNMAADDLRGAATSVSGAAIAVAEFTAGRSVWDRRRIASRESAVVAGALNETDRARAAALHLHLEPLSIARQLPFALALGVSRRSFYTGTALLAWGMWFGIVYRRWNLIGLLSFLAVQLLALTAALLVIGGANAWHSASRFFTTLTIEGLTGLLAVLTVALLAGGYATVRRLTV